MGKRKERRLAAKTASNRRVKLDLPPEPSGEFGESSSKEEVGDGGNAKNHAGSPDSPSSSGQKPENPLLLLGQYSDEEHEEELGKEISQDARENLPSELDEQVKVDIPEGTGADKDETLTTDKIDEETNENSPPLDVLPQLEENGVLEDNTAKSPLRDMDAPGQTSVPWTSDTQMTGDVDLGWKMVLHEESNSYYYWNVVTGETSWEVPVVIGQGNEPSYDPKSSTEVEERHVASVDAHMPNAVIDASVATLPNNGSTNTLVFEAMEAGGSRSDLDAHNEKYTNVMAKVEGNHVNRIDDRKVSSAAGVIYGSSHEGIARYSDDGEPHHTCSGIQDVIFHDNDGTVGDASSDSFRLLQLGESLLERLKSLKGSEGFNDQISKLMFELDIRLADVKSLVPYGSSLLPFWLHSENQLKKLEAAINNEALKCSRFTNIGEMNVEDKLHENITDATANERNATATASNSLEFDASDHDSINKEDENVLSGTSGIHADNVTATGSPYQFVDRNAQTGTVEAHEKAISAHRVPNANLTSVEDEDMDVEMEVEDAPVRNDPRVENGSQLDQCIPPNPEAQHRSCGSEEEFSIPPPPNDEWIPPPPPDDEPLPPPPPDEPSEANFPPAPLEIQTALAYSYGEQYNLTYPASNFEYYGQPNLEVPNHEYYVDANGCQVAAPLPTLYYAAVPNPYPDSTAVVNTGEPVTYYTLQETSLPTAPVIASVEASGLQKAVHESVSSDQTKFMVARSQVDVSAVDREIGRSSTEVPSVLPSTHVTASSTLTPDDSVASAPAVAHRVAPTEPIPKVQPKVPRNKKRTVATVPSLRSNKKVSGLVDKWKAVKDELHEEEEEEPENAFEVLEKKRQREIEQWYAQQIASGEAKENANFQPLGGDWRERVRRKRAKKSAEENEGKGIDDTNQQPDLVQLTKQLPSGWQAYWDEASKQVYYGNSATSETTWVKPTK